MPAYKAGLPKAVSRPLSAGAITGYLLLTINRHFHAISAACDEDDGEIFLRGSCSNPQDNEACDTAIRKLLFAAEFATSCVRFVQRVLEPWRVELQAAHAAVRKQLSEQTPPKRPSKKRVTNATVAI